MNYFETVLNKKPALLSNYIALGITFSNYAALVLGKFMRHLLVVQGVDPNTQPGARARQALIDAMNAVEDKHDYDKDYDFSWIRNKFQSARDKLSHFNLTKDKFYKLTDLSTFGNAPIDTELNVVAPESTKREIRITAPVEESPPTPAAYENIFNEGKLNSDSLKKALHTLKKYAQELEEDKTESFDNKLSRAQKLCAEMVSKGLCDGSKQAVDTQVNEIMKFNDDSFEALSRVVTRHVPLEHVPEKTPKTRVSKTKVTKTFKGPFRRVADKE